MHILAHIFYSYAPLKYYWVMKRNVIPKELKELKLFDGRPAYIFVNNQTGKFPTIGFCCDKNVCPYCGKTVKGEHCSCPAYKAAQEYNNSLSKE